MIKRIRIEWRPRAVEEERFLATFVRPGNPIPYGARGDSPANATRKLLGYIERCGENIDVYTFWEGEYR